MEEVIVRGGMRTQLIGGSGVDDFSTVFFIFFGKWMEKTCHLLVTCCFCGSLPTMVILEGVCLL